MKSKKKKCNALCYEHDLNDTNEKYYAECVLTEPHIKHECRCGGWTTEEEMKDRAERWKRRNRN